MSEIQPVIWHRSGTTLDWKCPRARWYQYEYERKGIVRSTTSLELFAGTVIHDCLATIATLQKEHIQIDIDAIAESGFAQMKKSLLSASEGELAAEEFATEQASLVEGLIRGFYKSMWPRVIQGKKILFVEEEIQYEHNGCLFLCKPDLILQDETDGTTVYWEYKSTSSKKEEWINSWDTAVQLHSIIKAMREVRRIEIDYVVIQALYKGFVSYGKQNSNLIYAYKKSGSPPFTQDQFVYEYKPGFRKYPVWELPGGVKKWVDDMPDEILVGNFPQTPPIFVNNDLVDKFFTQREQREKEIYAARERIIEHPEEITQLLDIHFPQHYDACQPGYGRPCVYKSICFGNVPNPLEQGWVYRTPHHTSESTRQSEATGELDGVQTSE